VDSVMVHNVPWHGDDLARFLSRDPSQEELNLYRYVANRPLVLVDPRGRQATDCVYVGAKRYAESRWWCPVGENLWCACRPGPPSPMQYGPMATRDSQVVGVKSDCRRQGKTVTGTCTCDIHTRITAPGGKVVYDRASTVPGKCAGRGPGAGGDGGDGANGGRGCMGCRRDRRPAESANDCFWRKYREYTTPKPSEFMAYYDACRMANAECRTHKTCNPCGVGGAGYVRVTERDCSVAAITATAESLRLKCGPHGADKLAHCWAFCMGARCYTQVVAALRLLLEVEDETDPLDLLADLAGVSCGRSVLFSCLGCCLRSLRGVPYHI
jgi:hypothetical protein